MLLVGADAANKIFASILATFNTLGIAIETVDEACAGSRGLPGNLREINSKRMVIATSVITTPVRGTNTATVVILGSTAIVASLRRWAGCLSGNGEEERG